MVNLSIYYTWEKIKSTCNNNKFKISAPTWNDKFNLPDGSYSIAEIQDYFEYVIKKHETIAHNHPVQIYVYKIKNKRKTGYKTRIIIFSNNEAIRKYKKKYVDKKKDGEDVQKLEFVEVVLLHCNLVNNSCLQASKVVFTFVPNKQFGQLITISPHSLQC